MCAGEAVPFTFPALHCSCFSAIILTLHLRFIIFCHLLDNLRRVCQSCETCRLICTERSPTVPYLHNFDGFLRCAFEVTAISIRLAFRMKVPGSLNVAPFLSLELVLYDQLLEILVLPLFEPGLLFQ